MAAEFIGRSRALSAAGLAAASEALQVPAARIWTVLAVETKGCGFLPDRRPPILFERHYFSKLTKGQFDAIHPDISNPQPGGYGAAGAHQYARLARAIQLSRHAALQSASWGLPQIMGANFAQAGHGAVDAMVASMMDSEDGQLAAFVEFLRTNGLHTKLRAQDWAGFARAYNGPDYAVNQYDVKLSRTDQKFTSIGALLPDLNVRAAQLYMTFAGVIPGPGPVDGMLGPQTKAALRGYQLGRGLPVTGLADEATLESLVARIEG